jgi:hypothetical protein
MMITQNTADLRKDAYLLGNTLLRLALPRLLIRVTVVLTILADFTLLRANNFGARQELAGI